jgi:hypothetical protein
MAESGTHRLFALRKKREADVKKYGECGAVGKKSGSVCIRPKGHPGGHASQGNMWEEGGG